MKFANQLNSSFSLHIHCIGVNIQIIIVVLLFYIFKNYNTNTKLNTDFNLQKTVNYLYISKKKYVSNTKRFLFLST